MALTRFAFIERSGLQAIGRRAARIAAITLGAASLSACAYGVGDYGGYGGVSVGVGSGGYAGGYDPYCDGYSAWDSFYGCDYGYGFGQIGYGGGYWDNFYYPGYGTWIYDRPGGRRFAMQDRHRQYWGSSAGSISSSVVATGRTFARADPTTGGTCAATAGVKRSMIGATGGRNVGAIATRIRGHAVTNASAWVALLPRIGSSGWSAGSNSSSSRR